MNGDLHCSVYACEKAAPWRARAGSVWAALCDAHLTQTIGTSALDEILRVKIKMKRKGKEYPC